MRTKTKSRKQSPKRTAPNPNLRNELLLEATIIRESIARLEARGNALRETIAKANGRKFLEYVSDEDPLLDAARITVAPVNTLSNVGDEMLNVMHWLYDQPADLVIVK